MTPGPITLVRDFGRPVRLELPALADAQERPVKSHVDVASAWLMPSSHVQPFASHKSRKQRRTMHLDCMNFPLDTLPLLCPSSVQVTSHYHHLTVPAPYSPYK